MSKSFKEDRNHKMVQKRLERNEKRRADYKEKKELKAINLTDDKFINDEFKFFENDNKQITSCYVLDEIVSPDSVKLFGSVAFKALKDYESYPYTKYLNAAYDNNFRIEVKYGYDTHNVNKIGRMKIVPSINTHICATTMRREIRAICFESNYYDFDIVNCQPNILFQIFKHLSIDCKLLENYVKNRQFYYDEFKNLEPILVKKIYVMINFGASLQTIMEMIGSTDLPQCVKDLHNEISRSKKELLKKESDFTLINDVREYIKKTCEIKKIDYDTLSNKEGKIISQILQTIEARIIDVAKTTLNYLDYSIDSIIYDGFLIRKDKPMPEENHISIIKQVIKKKEIYGINFDVDFKIKPFEKLSIFMSDNVQTLESNNLTTEHVNLFVRKTDMSLANLFYMLDDGKTVITDKYIYNYDNKKALWKRLNYADGIKFISHTVLVNTLIDFGKLLLLILDSSIELRHIISEGEINSIIKYLENSNTHNRICESLMGMEGIKIDEFETDITPYLLPFERDGTGMIFETKTKLIRPRTKEDKFSNTINVDVIDEALNDFNHPCFNEVKDFVNTVSKDVNGVVRPELADYYLENIAHGFLGNIGLTERYIFVGYGQGSEGKSGLFDDFFRKILPKEWCITAASNLFTKSNLSEHSNQSSHTDSLSACKNARVVIASEPVSYKKRLYFNEPVIKHFCDGTPISSRAVSKSTESFMPRSKVIVLTNDLPVLDMNVGEKIFMPMFDHKFPTTLMNQELKAKNQAIYNRVMNDLLRERFTLILHYTHIITTRENILIKIPDSVIKNTIHYIKNNMPDNIEVFKDKMECIKTFILDEIIILDNNINNHIRISFNELNRRYVEYCNDLNIEPIRSVGALSKQFKKYLGEFRYKRSNGSTYYTGIRFKNIYDDDNDDVTSGIISD